MDEVDLGVDGLSDYKELGSGGFSTVYEALDEGFGRRVAVKVLHSIDADGRRRFDRERLLMGRLDDHPNVVTPYRFGYTSTGAPYLMMELLHGGSLEDMIKTTDSIPVETIVGYIVPVAKALGRAHSEGILHRDIKPANILLTAGEEPFPKLADFGIAAIREATATQPALTIAHSPPEAFAETDQRDERSDLYSLASTVYNLVEGRGPFDALDGSTAIEGQIARILTKAVPATGHDGLDRFLATAMAKDPAHRYPTAAQFIEALTSITGTPRVVTEPEAPGPRLPNPMTGNVTVVDPTQPGPPPSPRHPNQPSPSDQRPIRWWL